eukprot:TRINITY_DN10021_c0_g1_i1.p2 TRINITY_DN10021_c0_g1~~TRINITY_DN10021_c0_g1_i1.p2  ORF type:complete len:132 (+),score=24.38 TRINITY_DN10021_c0_g1_i1:129-524(+)
MIRRPPRSTLSSSSAASDVYKRQINAEYGGEGQDGIMITGRMPMATRQLLLTMLCVLSSSDQCVNVIETEFCKGLMPLKVCSATQASKEYPELTSDRFAQDQQSRCPEQPQLLSKGDFCYPRPEVSAPRHG